MRTLLLLFLLAFTASAMTDGGAPKILVIGDSISAAYGIPVDKGWVARLQKRLEHEGYPHRVVNASVSGDTTSGGLARLPDALERHAPHIVVIELGGNDGLRGLALDAMAENLAAMVKAARGAGARVLLLGIRLPPNYGPAYTERFTDTFRSVAERLDVALVPRLLQDVGERSQFMQDDGIHPNAEGHARILETVWPRIEPLIGSTDTTARALCLRSLAERGCTALTRVRDALQ